MNTSRWLIQVALALLIALSLSPSGRAQDNGGAGDDGGAATQGVDSGNYNIQQTIDFGYRLNEVGGNYQTYDTFVNLQSGVRLFDYSLDMRSLNHNGLLFDNLQFSNFGYGGDPVDVSRLHIDKNKWYEFDASFRRYENFWDYNLFANPLNPASLNPVGSLTTGCYVGKPTTAFPQGAPGLCSSPAVGIANSPHSLDLVRRMQDYDLILFPQSRLRFRLGVSHYRDEGGGFLSGDIGGSVPDFPENDSYTTNTYRAGVDFRFLPRTTISYDQFLTYFKQDNYALLSPAATPGLFNYQVTNAGTTSPVYMGLIWSTQTPAETLPCANTAINSATTPPTVGTTCAGYSYYSLEDGRPRDFTPSERLRFESDYFHNFEMSGSFGYSSFDNKINDINEDLIAWTARSSTPGSTTAGPADAKEISVDGNWSGVYAVTQRFRIEDQFRYYNWRIPGIWNSELGALFNVLGTTGLGAPVGAFVSANCAGASFVTNEKTCPAHTSSSAADLVNAYNWNFLKQDAKTNTFKLDYDFTRRVHAYIGYLYDHRQIYQASLSYTTADFYYAGGSTGTASNDYLSERGSCAFVAGALPAGCSYNAATGIMTFIPTTAPPAPTTYMLGIDENALLAGFNARPIDQLNLVGEVTWGYNDAAYTRISPRQVQGYKLHATYTPKPWATLDGSAEIHENRDDVEFVNNLEHDRSYSFTAMLMPNPKLAVSFGYNYWNVFTQADVCFNYSVTSANPAGSGTITDSTSPPGVATFPCSIPTASVGAAGDDALSTYASTDHFAHADVMWKATKRVTTAIGYGGSFVRGNTIFLNPLTPSGTLDYNYQMPYASITVLLYKGLSYKTAWNYYGFNEAGLTNPFGLAFIPLQDFNGSNATFSIRYSF